MVKKEAHASARSEILNVAAKSSVEIGTPNNRQIKALERASPLIARTQG